MASSRCSPSLSGAIEHAPSRVSAQSFWNGALAFSNIGLSGEAVSGNKWRKHRSRLITLIVELLDAKEVILNCSPQLKKPLLGILLNEVGNLDHLLDSEGREKIHPDGHGGFQHCGIRHAYGCLEFRRNDGRLSI